MFEREEDLQLLTRGVCVQIVYRVLVRNQLRVKIRENTAPPTLRASDPEYRPLSTRPLAWLNLSQREKASVFVMVSTSAIATKLSVRLPLQIVQYHLPTKISHVSWKLNIATICHGQHPVRSFTLFYSLLVPPTTLAAYTAQARRTACPSC